ncbi:hypothetical protein MLD52_12940 [Puniceicoccaceae bacterium K14]|nr:hypothetical protein [Puniceicoccaceae bacterium K14]
MSNLLIGYAFYTEFSMFEILRREVSETVGELSERLGGIVVQCDGMVAMPAKYEVPIG